jgi:hypothetical protein
MARLRANRLTTFSVAADGDSASIGFAEDSGEASSLVLPTSCVHALIMTLPEIAQQALRRRAGDERLRLVFPVAHWALERIANSQRLILTFSTPDEFRVSFSMSQEDLDQIAATALADEALATELSSAVLRNIN